MNQFLKTARAKKFLSIEKASAMVGIDPRTFKRWERDDYNPQLYFLQKLCEALDAAPEELGYSISAGGKVLRIVSPHIEGRTGSNADGAVQQRGVEVVSALALETSHGSIPVFKPQPPPFDEGQLPPPDYFVG